MNILGSVALVTGAAHRVGKTTALELARAGADVVILYNNSAPAAAETARAAEALGVTAMTVQCDIADLQAVKQMAHDVRSRFGRLNILVNSADWFAQHPFPTENYDTWHRTIEVSVHGSFYVSNELATLLLQQPEGCGVDDAGELGQKAVAHALYGAPAMPRDRRRSSSLRRSERGPPDRAVDRRGGGADGR